MELRTPRLLLRDFRPEDADAVHAYAVEPAYLRHYDGVPPTRADTERLVGLFVAWAREVPRSRWQLAVTRDGACIGTCGVRRPAPDADEAEFGCELAPAAWGHGYAREACDAILTFAWSLPLRRIVAHTTPGNLAAIRLATALGFREDQGRYVLDRP